MSQIEKNEPLYHWWNFEQWVKREKYDALQAKVEQLNIESNNHQKNAIKYADQLEEKKDECVGLANECADLQAEVGQLREICKSHALCEECSIRFKMPNSRYCQPCILAELP